MRIFTLGVLAVLSLGCVSTSNAADLDYDVLRGADDEPVAAPVIDWGGGYVGGHGGYSSAALNQRDVFQSRLADYFRVRDIESEFSVSKLIALPSSHAGGPTYGMFAGYNVQLDDLVVGIEADYTHFGRTSSSTASIARIYTTSAGLSEVVALDGKSATTVENYGSIRARAGYAFGSFLPYLTGGFALGQVKVNDTISVQNYGYDAKAYAANQGLTSGSPAYVYRHGYASFNPDYPGNYSSPPGQTQTIPAAAQALTTTRSKTIGGAAFGMGLEYAVTSNILLRGEYQYVLFNDFDGHKATVNTVRGGAALKF